MFEKSSHSIDVWYWVLIWMCNKYENSLALLINISSEFLSIYLGHMIFLILKCQYKTSVQPFDTIEF